MWNNSSVVLRYRPAAVLREKGRRIGPWSVPGAVGRAVVVLLVGAVAAQASGQSAQPSKNPLALRPADLTEPGVQRTPHLSVTMPAAEAPLVPGARVSLRLDVAPAPNMHVYAPAERRYRSVSLALDPSPLIRVLEPRFPPPETYFFAPLQQMVLVYSKPFTIVQDVALDTSKSSQAALVKKKQLVVRGTLSYQACDDAICYLETKVPVAWTVTLRPDPSGQR